MEGWETIGTVDARIYRREKIGADGLRWTDGRLRGSDGPLPDDVLNEASVVNFIDRLPSEELVPFWQELYRVCVHGAAVQLAGAYWTSVDVQADLTRRRGLSERMIAHLSAANRMTLLADPLEDGVGVRIFDGIDFDVVRVVYLADPEWDSRSDEAKGWAQSHSLNVIRRLDAVLTVHKPCRTF